MDMNQKKMQTEERAERGETDKEGEDAANGQAG